MATLRIALSTLEMVVLNGAVSDNTITVTRETLEQCTAQKSLLYDKNGEEHYNLISALHKSMRNSDPDAAVYWAGPDAGSRRRPPLRRPTPDPVWPAKISDWPTPVPWKSLWLPIRPAISLECLSALFS